MTEAKSLLDWYAGLLADEARVNPKGGAGEDLKAVQARLNNFRHCPYALTCEVGVSCGCAEGCR